MKQVLAIPYEMRNNIGYPLKYDSKYKVAYFEGEELPDFLKDFLPQIFSYDWHINNKLNKTKPVFSYKQIWKAKDHQKEACALMQAAYKKNFPGFLLADDVGLGKTISALIFALNNKDIKNILIVCPVAIMAHWRKTLINLGVNSNKDILIINYERLGKLFESEQPNKLTSTKIKGKQKRIARELAAPEYDLILWDESHKCKNVTSARTQLAEKLTAKANFCIWLSATAGQTPLELSYLKRLLAKKTKSTLSSMKEFEVWCKEQGLGVYKGAFGAWKWDGEQKDIDKIKEWLFQGDVPCGIRRRPQEIAGWKEFERNLYSISLDEKDFYAYQKSWADFKAEEIDKVKKKKVVKEKSNALVDSLRFRQKSSWIKIDSTVDFILDLLEKGKQVAVSVEFKETQFKIAEILCKKKINVAIINGSQNEKEKESNRIAFQKGECPVVLFTVVEGISLHQREYNDVPRILLIHDFRWSAIQMAQIEGRCHRDGQFSPCYWLYAEGTKDEDIGNILIKRVKNMKEMMGDDTSLLKEIMDVFLKQ